jgi:hypothetical protein
MIDLGTGNNNKISWAMTDKQEFIDIVEVIYRGARKGRGLVVSPKDYSTKYRYALSAATPIESYVWLENGSTSIGLIFRNRRLGSAVAWMDVADAQEEVDVVEDWCQYLQISLH